MGRATGTACQGRVSVLLNDWGMAGELRNLNDDCLLGTCKNQIYRSAAEVLLFVAAGGVGGCQQASHQRE